MASVRLEKLYKQYPNGFVAIKDFNLNISDNEFVVLVGPSGCGKSTMLRMIAGLEEISGGGVYIDDRLVNDVEPKDRDCAMVFQNYALYPHMSVYDNMALGLKIRKIKKQEIKKRVDQTAKILGLAEFLIKKPRTLSGGQQQRVALGRAIVRDPKLFLLDEPLSNLDAKLRTKMRTEIIKLYLKLGTTFIYVTHDQVEAMTMGTKIVVMKDGEIQQADTPQNIFEKPKNMFVAGFIGSPEMNFIESMIRFDNQNLYLEIGDNRLAMPAKMQESQAVKKYVNEKVMVGIRPENISVFKEGSAIEPEAIHVKIEVSELLGSETLVYFKLNGKDFTAKISDTALLKHGQDIDIIINTGKIHLFDKQTQENICFV